MLGSFPIDTFYNLSRPRPIPHPIDTGLKIGERGHELRLKRPPPLLASIVSLRGCGAIAHRLQQEHTCRSCSLADGHVTVKFFEGTTTELRYPPPDVFRTELLTGDFCSSLLVYAVDQATEVTLSELKVSHPDG
ncbi:unnamed protein product [Victoria cruziana]